jgi:hypothetical protein
MSEVYPDEIPCEMCEDYMLPEDAVEVPWSGFFYQVCPDCYLTYQELRKEYGWGEFDWRQEGF